MENMLKTMREHFPVRTVVIEQSLDMFGVKRNEDGTLLFPRHSDKRFPVARIRKGTVAKLAMRQPFVLFKGLTFQKLCLPGAFRPG
ncbi:hypothetical protein CCS48_00130, partial [Salmonella enterica subsp. enterica serovar Enteritidis]